MLQRKAYAAFDDIFRLIVAFMDLAMVCRDNPALQQLSSFA